MSYMFQAQCDISSLKPENAQPKWKVSMGFASVILSADGYSMSSLALTIL